MKSILKLTLCALLSWHALTMQAGTTVTQIAAGGVHSLFIKSDGSLWGMGDNGLGQLGAGHSIITTNQPLQIVSNSVTTISAGQFHSLFRESDGSLWAMGRNASGQLGDGTTNDSHVPELIMPNQVGLIAAGGSHSLFAKFHNPFGPGSFWAMGDNLFGQLGDGTFSRTNQPEQILSVPTGTAVSGIAAGDRHSLFVKPDGSLWAMGYNLFGQLGDGTTNNRAQPVQIVASNVTAVAAGGGYSLFIKSDGSLWAMGSNEYGQLGDGTTTDRHFPVQIMSNNVTAIAAGVNHSLFIKSDGSLWAMGENDIGQLGDGTFTNRDIPEQIVPGGVIAISAGGFHSLFLKSDGSLWVMGLNSSGQLGLAGPNITSITIPTQSIPLATINGGFETGDFLGWTSNGNFSSTDNLVSAKRAYAHSGRYGAEMGPVGSPGYLSQTLLTIPGAIYLLSFWLDSPDGETPNEFLASWNGVTLLDKTNLPATGWTNFHFVVTATGAGTVLQFGFRDDNTFFGFDDVSIVQVVQPVITGISLAGTNLVLNASNGLSGVNCYTLMTTDVTQPLNQWSPIATNVLSADGAFTVTATNGVDPNAAQQFYVLELQ